MEKPAAMQEELSEGQLIEACRGGDREAFRCLFELHRHRVWSIALSFSGNEATASDISQQVFLKLFTGIGQYRGEASFGTWLYRLVANACLDEHRRRRRWIPFDLFGEGEEEVLEEEEPYTRQEASAAVKAAIRQLPPKLRIAILLKHFEGLSYEEMGWALGCSPGTVASRLNRGHTELARRLAHWRGVFGKSE